MESQTLLENVGPQIDIRKTSILDKIQNMVLENEQKGEKGESLLRPAHTYLSVNADIQTLAASRTTSFTSTNKRDFFYFILGIITSCHFA